MVPGGQLDEHVLSPNGCLPILCDTSTYDISMLGISILLHKTRWQDALVTISTWCNTLVILIFAVLIRLSCLNHIGYQ